MKNFVSRDTHLPLYSQIQDILRQEYTGKDIPAGAPLPSETEMMQRFSVSRATIRKALDGLEAQGMIYKVQGQGSFTRAAARISSSLSEPITYKEMLTNQGYEAGVQLLSAERVLIDERLQEKLKLEKGAEMISMSRIFTADGIPVIYLINSIPLWVLGEDLAQELLKNQSIADPIFGFLANRCGNALHYYVTRLRPDYARNCPIPITTYPPETLCLALEDVGLNLVDKPIMHSSQYFPDDRMTIELVRTRSFLKVWEG